MASTDIGLLFVIKLFAIDLKMGIIVSIYTLSGTWLRLKEELFIHDNGVAITNLDDLAVEGFMSSTPAVRPTKTWSWIELVCFYACT